jgi:hypothetical protein
MVSLGVYVLFPVFAAARLEQHHVPDRLKTMTTTLPLESHKDRSLFLEHEVEIGSAYRNRALDLISMCRLISQTASPNCVHEDAELKG